MVKCYEIDAAGGGVDPQLATAINLSGRQRMLAQRMSKEYFLAIYGYEPKKNRERLKKTIAMFDATLRGLINGDETLGLPPAPNEAIKRQLEKVNVLWADFKKTIESGSSASEAVAKNNPVLLKEMNTAVYMFEQL